jgi:DNA ligase-1
LNRFADLLDMLVFTPSRNAKLSLLRDYFRRVPDPERGYALAAIARDLDIPAVKPAQLRELISSRMDPELFGYSYDYVGDLAETIALAWPEKADSRPGRNDAPGLAEVVETLQASSRREGPGLVEGWLDRLDPPGRYALLKLVTGGFRMGLSSRLIKQALAGFGQVEVNEIEELWHGLSPPYADLFAWLEGSGPKPVNAGAAPFRPVMLSHAIEDRDFEKLDPADFAAEWKWDGIRVQATSERGISRLYTRTGDDISAAFPDLVDAIAFDGALDGELLVARPSGGGVETGSFSDLQQRLNRKTVTAKQLREHPAFFRAYDLLQDGEEDLRSKPFIERRNRLETFVTGLNPERFDCSAMLAFDSWDDLAALRADPPFPVIEGVMIKRKTAPYLPGRPKGEWFKWKRDPFPDRRGADVRPARPWQTFGLLLRLHLRCLARARRACARRQGLFRLHRRGTPRDRQICPQQHHRAFRSGPLGARRGRQGVGLRGCVRGDSPLLPAQVRCRHALSPHQPAALGQAAGRGRPAGDARKHDRQLEMTDLPDTPAMIM